MGSATHFRYRSPRRLLATTMISRNWAGRCSRTLEYRCASALVSYLAVSCTRSTAATQIVPSARRRTNSCQRYGCSPVWGKAYVGQPTPLSKAIFLA